MKYFAILCVFSVLCFHIGAAQEHENFCVIIDTNIELKDHHTDNAKTIMTMDDRCFGKSFDILDETGKYIKIRKDNTEGWLKAEIDKSILRNDTQSASRYIQAKKKDLLTKKCIVVNNIKYGEEVRDVKIYSNCRLEGNPLGMVTLFELRYIFAETEKSVLTGFSDRFTKPNSEVVLKGWIDKKFIIEWNNRIGIEFNKSNFFGRKPELGGIYYSEIDLLNDAKAVITEEDSDKPMSYYANRFPVISDKDMMDKIKKESNGIVYYRIAFIGGGPSGDDHVSAGSIEDAKEQIAQRLKNTSLRVAILIDATKGMGDYISSVKEALNSFFKSVVNKDTRDILFQIGIATYRDYPDGDDIFKVRCNFTNELKKLTDALDNISTHSNDKDNGIGTYPEALFYGIDHAIEGSDSNKNKLDWGNEPGERYIILIGDHGNHEDYSQYPDDKIYNNKNTQDKIYNNKNNNVNIAEKLKNKNISLYAVQVHITNDSLSQYNKTFEKQINEIIGSNKTFGTLEKVKEKSDDKIFNALNKAYESFNLIRDVLFCVRQGCDLRESGYNAQFVQEVLQRYNINAEIYKTVQGCAEGFVKEKNKKGLKQIEERVLMTKTDVENLKGQMNTLIKAIHDHDKSPDPEILKETINNVVKALSGDKPGDGENIAVFIERKTGIPIKTDFLDTTVEGLIDKLGNKENRITMAQDLADKVVKLEKVFRERKFEIKRWNEGTWSYDYNETNEPYPNFFSLELPIQERGTKQIDTSKKLHVWLKMELLP